MNLPQRKFEVGEKVVDTFKDKVYTVTSHQYDNENHEWLYSFDSLGWYLVPESDLVKHEGK